MNNHLDKQRKILTFLFLFVTIIIAACQRDIPRGDDVMVIEITGRCGTALMRL